MLSVIIIIICMYLFSVYFFRFFFFLLVRFHPFILFSNHPFTLLLILDDSNNDNRFRTPENRIKNHSPCETNFVTN